MRKLPFDNTGLTILTGGLGSGKTELAVNLAFCISQTEDVAIVDLDNIKPYFKARNLDEKYRTTGVRIIAPEAPYSDTDLPILPPQARSIISGSKSSVIVDAGGDEAGARVLGGYAEEISQRNYKLFFVVNISRPYLRNSEAIVEMVKSIEYQSGLKASGLINNTHLMYETTLEVVEKGRIAAQEAADILNIPLAFTSLRKDLPQKPKGNIFEMDLYFYNKV